jgi:hypothetical protein
MDEILKLQPGEIWVWLYLCKLAKEQKSEIVSGTLKVTLPFMRENKEVQAVYSPRQFLRHLLSLASKNFLMIFNREKNWRCQITVGLAASFYLDMGVQVPGHGCPGRGENEEEKATWTPMSKKETRADGEEEGYLDMGVQEKAQLSLSLRVFKESFKAWMELDQRRLLRAVMNLEPGQKEEMEIRIYRIAPKAKAKKRSREARLYAALRFIQDGNRQARNAAAWIEGVARRADYQMEELRRGSKHDQKAVADHYTPQRAAAAGPFHRTGA